MHEVFNRAALALLFAGMSCALPAQAGPGNRSVAEQYLFAAANAERAQRGVPLLRWDNGLHLATGAHAQWMVAARSIAHGYAGEPELAYRAQAAGVRFSRVTENVGEAQTAVELHKAWMNSAHHRENLLDAEVDAVAISVLCSEGQLYAVEDFVRTVAPLTFEAQEEAVFAALARVGTLQQLPQSASARETCRLPQGYAGVRQPSFVMRYTTGDLHVLPANLRQTIAAGHVRQAAVGACSPGSDTPFASYAIAVLLYP